MFSKYCFYKKSVWLFLLTGATQYFFIIRHSDRFSMQFAFFFCSLIANVETQAIFHKIRFSLAFQLQLYLTIDPT